MNSLEKKSFYSFLGLYVISSSFFIIFSAYWYFNDQKDSFIRNQSLNIEYISTTVSQNIIASHMRRKSFVLQDYEGAKIALFNTDRQIKEGSLDEKFIPTNPGTFELGKYKYLVSDAPQDHLNIKFVVVQAPLLLEEITQLKQDVITVMSIAIFIMVSLAWVLSKLFMRPLHQKIKQIEGFVHDTAHELNTPITALSMSVSRALKKKGYDEKILKNISISTKQLFDIYTALSYLSFERQAQEEKSLNIKEVLEKSVEYYKELCESKKISIELEVEDFEFKIDITKLNMLFGNLISNAIKYSPANSKVKITLLKGVFKIKDEGIGIDKDKLSQIYERYNRQTDYAGGFGIGLSIVQKLSQEYKLGLSVESEIDKGSCFTLQFS